MRPYAIDLDIFKDILKCHKTSEIKWRVSASRKGFHISWLCSKKWCKVCSNNEKKYDDPLRYHRDKNRPIRARKVLWDRKGKRKALTWHVIE